MLRSYRTPYQNDYSWELVQPGGGLVFVTRQAQSKIDKVLWKQLQSNGRYIKAIFKITGKKTVADSLTCYPARTEFSWGSKASKQHQFYQFFSQSTDVSRQRASLPKSPGQKAPLFFIQVCSVLVEIKSGTLASPSFVNPCFTPPVKSWGTVRQSGLF